MASIRGYMAASVDGYIADAAGGVDWLEPFNAVDVGYARFIAGIGTVVMGRTTYDQCIGFGAEWVYAGKRGLVVTSRALSDPPADVAAWRDGIGALVQELRAIDDGDVWIVGGAMLQSAFIEQGALDRLELFVMPLLLGSGVPLFRSMAQSQALSLDAVEQFDMDIARLDYRMG